jgi:hypothetical protein
MPMNREQLAQVLTQLHQSIGSLKDMFPHLHFTLDGHLIGSIGEAIAEHYYGLTLNRASSPCHDGVTANGQFVQIKVTQGTRVAIRSCPDQLLVLQLHRSGDFAEIYNGPGYVVWTIFRDRRTPRNGQYQVSIAKLKKLNANVVHADRIPRVRT